MKTETLQEKEEERKYRYEENPLPNEKCDMNPNIVLVSADIVQTIVDELTGTLMTEGKYLRIPLPNQPDYYEFMGIKRPVFCSYALTRDDSLFIESLTPHALKDTAFRQRVSLESDILIESRTIDSAHTTPVKRITIRDAHRDGYSSNKYLRDLVLNKCKRRIGKFPKEKEDKRIQRDSASYSLSAVPEVPCLDNGFLRGLYRILNPTKPKLGFQNYY